jgi:predicted DNA-binding ribbon-helix-helix protein
MKTAVKKRSVVIGRHKTSISLENEFWDALKEIAHAKQLTVSSMISSIQAEESQSNLSSTIRLFVFQHFRTRGENIQP